VRPTPTAVLARRRALLRLALSADITMGLSVAFGLLLIAGTAQLLFGAAAAATVGVGVVVAIPPDSPAPRRGKLWQLFPAALIGAPLFYVTALVRDHPVALSMLLVVATFIAFLGAAWGKRGIPISMSIMFSMIFSLAEGAETGAQSGTSALASSLYMAGGAFSYVVYATIANAMLNARYRVQMLADALLASAALIRTQAAQFTPSAEEDGAKPAPLIGQLLQQQAVLADQLQAARNLLLETPETPRRQQLAAMLMQILELRDHLMASELDLDTLKRHPSQLELLAALRGELEALAEKTESLADALLLGRKPEPFDIARPDISASEASSAVSTAGDRDRSRPDSPSPSLLALGLVARIGYIHEEVRRLTELARGDAQPDLEVVYANWQMFTSPTAWSLRPFLALWHWDAPPLRHAIRAALAIAAGHGIALALPWGTHDYWILLTITVVLRGSFAQTIERRNHRVLGTLLGCLLAAGLLLAHVSRLVLQMVATLAQGIAHAFAAKRYFVTAVAATVLGLLQSQLLRASTSATFDVVERIADTLIGCGIAWGFSYLLPSWEKKQIPSLVARTLDAQADHVGKALALAPGEQNNSASELDWRLARREVYDSLSALVQATQRSLFEPRAVRPALEPLGRMLAHSYQLIAQLTAIKGMLLLRRERLDMTQLAGPLTQAAQTIEETLGALSPPRESEDVADTYLSAGPVELMDPLRGDLSPWLLRRLDLSIDIARKLRAEAARVG
jgi:uncharacterized membrane protein YccC